MFFHNKIPPQTFILPRIIARLFDKLSVKAIGYLLFSLSLTFLTACNMENITQTHTPTIKFATYNLSFDRNSYEELIAQLSLTHEQQQKLVDAYKFNKDAMPTLDKKLALAVIQIRNIAAVIQQNRPDVLQMGEFNNDGTGSDLSALTAFQTHYLAHPQSPNSLDGGDWLTPIYYPYQASFSTNTGLQSGYDLDNNGKIDANDAWGYGNYHGQYAFALYSKFEIDLKNTRTFQHFKWKDMPGAVNPTHCPLTRSGQVKSASCTNQLTDKAWANIPLSSKNHVDVPILLPEGFGTNQIHVLLSHPAPPSFNTQNVQRNGDEIRFWHDYINGETYLYDDKGTYGGLPEQAYFVIMGDQNADPYNGNGIKERIDALLSDPKINTDMVEGELVPVSQGGLEQGIGSIHPERSTASFSSSAMRVDYVLPSRGLSIQSSGVYWPASSQAGHLLLNDPRIVAFNWKGEEIAGGSGKAVSSDHRMVWASLFIAQ